MPKKKFTFKTRKKDNPSPLVQMSETAKSEKTELTQASNDVADLMVGFKDRKNVKLGLTVSIDVLCQALIMVHVIELCKGIRLRAMPCGGIYYS